MNTAATIQPVQDWRATQNSDGGWAYSKGCSWAEPTVYVLLAQHAASPDRESFPRGIAFLNSIARSDGGFSPQRGVEESTWVTALVALLPEAALSERQRRRAIDWLKSRTGQESSWRYKLHQRLNGDNEEYPEGWPWFPGAAAWVIPTSMGLLAFQRAVESSLVQASDLKNRIDAGRRFLLTHMGADGGWNHGSNRALGRDGDSYPETTGIALLALRGVPASEQMEKAKTAARKHLATCKTAEGIAWLRMGLAAHGEQATASYEPVRRTIVDHALMSLASASRNPLIAV